MRENVLWYKRPAAEWIEGLPVGTGRLAAMVLGGVKTERLALNHEWLWRGRNRGRDCRPVADRLDAVRRLLLDGKYEEGTRAGNEAFGNHAGKPAPNRVDPYQPAGDLFMEFNHACVSGYRRSLDLATGIVTVSYDARGARYKRETLAHLGADLILMRVSHVEHLVTDFATDSLLDLHPPRIFQIDGNLGCLAAVHEMLLQSYHGEIHLLPALPSAWPEGRVAGLRARGAFGVEIAWREGGLVEARIRAGKEGPCRVVDPMERYAVGDADGAEVATSREGHLLVFAAEPGAVYRLFPCR